MNDMSTSAVSFITCSIHLKENLRCYFVTKLLNTDQLQKKQRLYIDPRPTGDVWIVSDLWRGHYIGLFVWWCLRSLSAIFQLIVEVTGENNQSVASQWQSCHIMVYTSLWSRLELTSVVIGTDCIGICKFKYHTITSTTAPNHISNNKVISLVFFSPYISVNQKLLHVSSMTAILDGKKQEHFGMPLIYIVLVQILMWSLLTIVFILQPIKLLHP